MTVKEVANFLKFQDEDTQVIVAEHLGDEKLLRNLFLRRVYHTENGTHIPIIWDDESEQNTEYLRECINYVAEPKLTARDDPKEYLNSLQYDAQVVIGYESSN